MKDNITGFTTPTFELNDNVAIRNFKFALNNKDSLLYANAKDFDLYMLGVFDSEKGEITPCLPTIVVTGSSVIE